MTQNLSKNIIGSVASIYQANLVIEIPNITENHVNSRYVLIQIWSFCAGRKTSCSGIFAYVCTEKLSFVDYLSIAQKKTFVQDWSL